jgi:carboxymethylenebutenolidase
MPKQTPAPAVILIQEIFGVNQEMRDKCDALAAQGYIAVCPDLFWRMEPGVQLTDKSEAEWQKAFDLMSRFDIDAGVDDLRSTIHHVKVHESCSGEAAAIGYCLGGKLAYLVAARTEIDCSISYYGVGIEDMLAEAENISKPLLMHIAEEDEYVSKDAQAIIREELKDSRDIHIYTYPGVNHAFARGGGVHYDEASAQLANQRSDEFLNSHLFSGS